MGEFELIERFFSKAPLRRARLGIGDDCALLGDLPPGECLAISTDMLVAGRHFFDDVDPWSLGWKSLAVNLSDLAAMGAKPLAFTLSLALPDVDETWLGGFAAGLLRLAADHDCELVGGDTTRGPLTIGITIFGHLVPALALRRDAGRPGDDLWLSGPLGGAAFALRERLAGRALSAQHTARRRLELPQPRVALGRALSGHARCAIDVSDGLLGDLGHLCARSGTGAVLVFPDLPVDDCLAGLAPREALAMALTGGDDYELLFAAPPAERAWIAALDCPRPRRIGRLVQEAGIRLLDADGGMMSIDGLRAFDHFQ